MLSRRLSVGHLVQTLYRQGGLFDRRSLPLAPLEGLRVQQRYQASKGADYEREVRLAGTFPQGALELRLGGRADGVLVLVNSSKILLNFQLNLYLHKFFAEPLLLFFQPP